MGTGLLEKTLYFMNVLAIRLLEGLRILKQTMETLLDIARKAIQEKGRWICGDPFHKMRVEWVDRVWATGVVERGRRRILTPRRRTEAS
jgi:hypothetical protein